MFVFWSQYKSQSCTLPDFLFLRSTCFHPSKFNACQWRFHINHWFSNYIEISYQCLSLCGNNISCIHVQLDGDIVVTKRNFCLKSFQGRQLCRCPQVPADLARKFRFDLHVMNWPSYTQLIVVNNIQSLLIFFLTKYIQYLWST